MAPTRRLAAAGFCSTAIAFGPARMGFGLFLPAWRDDFALSSTLAGVIASAAFLAFLAALPIAAVLAARVGERAAVVLGTAAATAGFALVAVAEEPLRLAAGVALAGTSAGFGWAPFNDAAERTVPERRRAEALSVVSSGTTVGVALAAALALAVSYGVLDWRRAWAGFALAGAAAVIVTSMAVPAKPRPGVPAASLRSLIGELGRSDARPLHAAAVVFGAANAVFLGFAADHVVAAGGLPGLRVDAAAAVVFLGYGTCGAIGFATGSIEARLGLARLVRTIFAASALSLALLALAPGSWPVVVASAGLQGAVVMTMSAVLSFWSLRLFPGLGSIGFTAALMGVALGSAIGPALAGLLADGLGGEAMLLIAAAPSTVLAFRFRAPRRCPAG